MYNSSENIIALWYAKWTKTFLQMIIFINLIIITSGILLFGFDVGIGDVEIITDYIARPASVHTGFIPHDTTN